MTERRETDRSDFQPDGERIAKYLASAGVASRRDVEKMIVEGRVSVDGKKLETPAFKVTGQEKILVDGRPVSAPEATRLWRYHKPSGLVTTNRDPEGRATIFEALPANLPRVVTIGRLDLTTEGLLLLTSDGELARAMELPATGLARKYRARAFGRVQQKDLDRLRDGIVYEGIEYRSIIATLDRATGSNCWIDVSLGEGKNREVRRALESLGLKVNRLIRVSYGPLELGDLEPGVVEEVPAAELLAEFAALIPERRRPVPFAGREKSRGTGKGRDAKDNRGKTHKPKGTISKADWRSDSSRPRSNSGGHSGQRHTGKPVRAKEARGAAPPPGMGPRPAGQGPQGRKPQGARPQAPRPQGSGPGGPRR